MQNCQTTWEDDENNRHVLFSVAYSAGNGQGQIERMTPTHVTFVCPETKTALRTIGVRTEKGKTLLAERFRTSVAFEQFQSQTAV